MSVDYEKYENVFDVPAYKKALPQRIGFVLANKGNHLYDETIRLMKEYDVAIPEAAYECEKQFRAAMDNLKKNK